MRSLASLCFSVGCGIFGFGVRVILSHKLSLGEGSSVSSLIALSNSVVVQWWFSLLWKLDHLAATGGTVKHLLGVSEWVFIGTFSETWLCTVSSAPVFWAPGVEHLCWAPSCLPGAS